VCFWLAGYRAPPKSRTKLIYVQPLELKFVQVQWNITFQSKIDSVQ